jgi:hypothetical protein
MWLALSGAPARAGDPDFIAVHGGYWDFHQLDDPAGIFGIEYRSNYKPLYLHPFIGAFGTSDSAFYGYFGLGLDLFFGRRIVITPNTAVGYFEKGSGKELGNRVEFRSGVEIAYRFDDKSRLGVAIHHLSNASLGDRNPGVENLIVTYALPLDKLLGR